ncbi:hypothetical protein QE152_g7012 [Popillia japonica]|uniref:Uncharacterized protein n=1 Tax=Popillia japonica TaxID=7064 RepID=A0AAW1MCK4_POPJA
MRNKSVSPTNIIFYDTSTAYIVKSRTIRSTSTRKTHTTSKKPDDQINVDEEDSHHEVREDDAIAYRSGKLEFNPGYG